MNIGMMGRGGPMGGPIGGAISGPMGGPPPNMMGRGMPGGMAAGMGPGGWHPPTTLPSSALILSPGVMLVDLAEQYRAGLSLRLLGISSVLKPLMPIAAAKVKAAMVSAPLLCMHELCGVLQSFRQSNLHLDGHGRSHALAGNMGGGMHAMRGSGSMSGTGMMPFGGPGGMSLPSPFTAGAAQPATARSRLCHDRGQFTARDSLTP